MVNGHNQDQHRIMRFDHIVLILIVNISLILRTPINFHNVVLISRDGTQTCQHHINTEWGENKKHNATTTTTNWASYKLIETCTHRHSIDEYWIIMEIGLCNGRTKFNHIVQYQVNKLALYLIICDDFIQWDGLTTWQSHWSIDCWNPFRDMFRLVIKI